MMASFNSTFDSQASSDQAQAASTASAVSETRYAKLARGVNLPGWFWFGAPTQAEREARFTDEGFATLRELGMTYVRLPIDLEFIVDLKQSDVPNRERLAEIDRALDRLTAKGLAVIVEIHSTSLKEAEVSQYSGGLENNEQFVQAFIRFWRAFAGHLSKRDPEMIFMAPINEPVFRDAPEKWVQMQPRILGAMRDSAPQHTLLATGANYSSIETLITTIKPLADPNIVYEFHFYEPFLFTHQGADWTSDFVKNLRDLPYPSTPEKIAPMLDSIAEVGIRNQVRDYGQERWNKERLQSKISKVAEWGKRNAIRLVCTEFGVFKKVSPPSDRVQWHRDMREVLEANGIGWALWDYDDGFGLFTRQGSTTILDEAMAEALGLKVAR